MFFLMMNSQKKQKVVYSDPRTLTHIADTIQAKHTRNGKITWGMPAKIASCRDSRSCGVCGARRAIYEGTRLVGGVDFIEENGEIVAAACSCGFAFDTKPD